MLRASYSTSFRVMQKKCRPTPGGNSEEVLRGHRSTTCFTAIDVLLSKIRSPAYTALICGVPTRNVEVVNDAEPPVNDPVPSTVEPPEPMD